MDGVGLRHDFSPHVDMSARFRLVRQHTDHLARCLSDEDQCIQSMPDASPTKWHRAHTTWFFEEFVLVPSVPGYRPFDPVFRYLFNSYYDAVGDRHPRPFRGVLSRPSASHVTHYRAHVDTAMEAALPQLSDAALTVVQLGLQHEQQHQELLQTDMLHAFSLSPLYPAIDPDWVEPDAAASPTDFIACPGGVHQVGYTETGFCFDNETPAHRVYLNDYALAAGLVRNREWQAFIEDKGYQTSSLWMSDGWATVQASGWTAPFYWRRRDDDWFQFGPSGLQTLRPDAPVRHLSWYEADAFARWSGCRLPTEMEWEVAADDLEVREKTQRVWQWTDSGYRPYPGYRPPPGAIGEYNGKFMINQMVLRGGSVATPPNHTRTTYRNFFHPDKRWQFSGLRLARDL